MSFAQSNNARQPFCDSITLRVFSRAGHTEQLVNQMKFVLYKDSTFVRFWNSGKVYEESRTVSIDSSLISSIERFENQFSDYRIDNSSNNGETYRFYIEFDDGNAEVRFKLKEESADILKEWFGRMNQ